MADRKIDQLTESEEISDEDLFVIWKDNISQTRSIQMQNVFNPVYDYIETIRQQLLEAMQPDWQNAISLTAAQLQAGYTAPADGMIVGNGAGTSSITELSVNNIIVAVGTFAGGVYVRLNVSAIVKSGDIIKTSANLNTVCQISFVPFMTMDPVSLRPADH